MKLHKKKSKLFVIIPLAIIVAILVVILIGIAVLLIPSGGGMKPTILFISSPPNKTVYLVGEEFEPQGIKAQVNTNAWKNSYFVDYTELTFEGFDSSTPQENLAVTVRYGDISTQLYVTIREEGQVDEVYLSDIEVIGLKTTYTLSDWNKYGVDASGASIKRIYSDGTVNEENVSLQYSHIKNYAKMDSAGTTEITVSYKENGKRIEKVVTITITN